MLMIVELKKKKSSKTGWWKSASFETLYACPWFSHLTMHLPHVEDSQTAGLPFPIRGPRGGRECAFLEGFRRRLLGPATTLWEARTTPAWGPSSEKKWLDKMWLQDMRFVYLFMSGEGFILAIRDCVPQTPCPRLSQPRLSACSRKLLLEPSWGRWKRTLCSRSPCCSFNIYCKRVIVYPETLL